MKMIILKIQYTIFFFAMLHLFEVLSASPQIGTKFQKVQGTYWTGATWVQKCLYQDWPQPNGLPEIAVANNLYQDASYCGVCVNVTTLDVQGNAVTKTGIINTVCADCPENALDMAPALYNSLMSDKPGRPGLAHFDWVVVECNFNSQMYLINKDGASRDHFSMQVAGHKIPVTGLRVQAAGTSTWLQTQRKDYNYFELLQGESLNRATSLNIEVTCSNDKIIITKNVPVDARESTPANGKCE